MNIAYDAISCLWRHLFSEDNATSQSMAIEICVCIVYVRSLYLIPLLSLPIMFAVFLFCVLIFLFIHFVIFCNFFLLYLLFAFSLHLSAPDL